jgi:autophagy-related protein 18
VVLEEHIYVYDISNMKLLHTIDTSPNPNALCSLSPSSENCFLVYPSNASSALGEVLVFDGIKLQAVNIVQAHKSPLACLSFNYEGRLVATSSDKVNLTFGAEKPLTLNRLDTMAINTSRAL